MQDPILLAFRKRLKRGYTDIHIKQARSSLGFKNAVFML